MTSGLLIWLGLVIPISIALAVRQRLLRGGHETAGAWVVVGAGAMASLLVALLLGWWRDRQQDQRLDHAVDRLVADRCRDPVPPDGDARLLHRFLCEGGQRRAAMRLQSGAHVEVAVLGQDAIAFGPGVAAAGEVHRIWFLDEGGAPLVAMDLSTEFFDLLRGRPELDRAASVRLVAEPPGSPRPVGATIASAPLEPRRARR